MATALKNLTRLGTSPRQIARLLQAKAPEGHMLAYITPEEADILKQRGGSGKPHADTGVPSFAVDGEGLDFETEAVPYGAEPADAAYPTVSAAQPEISVQAPIDYSAYSTGAPTQDIQLSSFPQIQTPTAVTPAQISQATRELQAPAAAGEELGIADKLAKGTGLSKDTLARLGLAGGLGLLGGTQARKAEASAQAGAEEMKQLAAPYRQQGQQLQAAAQRGELTPTGQQSLQALQAQLAQGATARGGVGTAQAAAQVEAFRQQLLQNQYDYGLKLSGIGDNIALGAIKTGMQADKYVQDLNSSFYRNMATIAAGGTGRGG
jgi:hypothetical protein